MENGWIKIHNKFLKWEWYTDSSMVALWIHLLLKANWKDSNWKGRTIKRGQLVAGRKALALQTGLSQQQIRTCLTRLKSTNEITIESTNKFSIITIIKWEEYQGRENNATTKTTSKLTNEQPTNNQQTTTSKEDKNIRLKDKRESHVDFLMDIPDQDIKEFSEKFNVYEQGIRGKAEDLFNYCKAKNKKYSDYKAFLRNALKKDFGLRLKEAPKPWEDKQNTEVSQEGLKKLHEIKKNLNFNINK